MDSAVRVLDPRSPLHKIAVGLKTHFNAPPFFSLKNNFS
jgi:hypothetical protein